MCMVLNRFQIKSFCRVEERDYKTSILPTDSDSKSQTEVSWLECTQPQAFHFHPGQTQVWVYSQCEHGECHFSQVLRATDTSTRKTGVRLLLHTRDWPARNQWRWFHISVTHLPTHLAADLCLPPLDNPLGDSAWQPHWPERCRAFSQSTLCPGTRRGAYDSLGES